MKLTELVRAYPWRIGVAVAIWLFLVFSFALQARQYHDAIQHSDLATCHALQRGWDSIHLVDIVTTEPTPIPPNQQSDPLVVQRYALATAHKIVERQTLLTTLGPRPPC